MSSKNHWLDDPRNVKMLWRGFLVLLAVVVAAELLITLHPHFAIDAVPAFHAVYGFLACAVMIVVAKLLGLLLKRPDTYYSADNDH
jgi:hypothetical protein